MAKFDLAVTDLGLAKGDIINRVYDTIDFHYSSGSDYHNYEMLYVLKQPTHTDIPHQKMVIVHV